ncbi:terminase small subunit [Escherichia coli]|uniref:Terminase small subunit n=1 Tax=Escherichia coli TaxID=562 RepID=A0A376MWN4_ECOLX|nr:terminase small subunit [Escherichia coli]
MLVAQGKKPTEAYRLAGYEGQGATANSNASRMLRNARVFRAISYFRNQYQKRYTADLDLLVSQLMAIVLADPNQLAQFRRVNCRYCWGENHLYQWRDIAEFDKAAAQASRDGKPEPEYGGLGFVDNAIPNPDCPKCCGEGTGQLYMADTTLLDGDARQLYAGAKFGKFGVEILLEDKAAARRELLRLFSAGGLYVQISGYRNWKLNGAEWKTRSCAKRSKRWKIMNIPSLWRSILMWLMPE